MANEELPITPELISWARTRAGLSLEEASKKFKRISDWEAGKGGPTYPQLEALAEAFKVPIAVFFFPAPPDVPNISRTFRTLPEAELDNLPSRILLLLRKAKAMQLNLRELNRGENPSERLITRDLSLDGRAGLVEMAQRVREYLNITLEDQQRWKDDDTALKEWRQAIVAVGVYIFKDAFRTNEYSGLSLYDELFPIIYVNNSSAKTRQIFTLFHELAHLLLHTSGIDTLHDEYIPRLADDAQRLEILCNRFAAEFLVPDSVFSEALKGKKPTEGTAQELAARFHVSREFVFRRFLDRGLIREPTYQEAADRWAKQKQSESSGGDYYRTKLSYLGRDYVGLALREFHQNRINEAQLAEYLDTRPRNLPGIEDYFSRGGG
jgi:Zn-dependent peptidase ImmA (M78 family)/transcriptional regulator with XRE-family HTH domain